VAQRLDAEHDERQSGHHARIGVLLRQAAGPDKLRGPPLGNLTRSTIAQRGLSIGQSGFPAGPSAVRGRGTSVGVRHDRIGRAAAQAALS
jgi:hypothetical protein